MACHGSACGDERACVGYLAVEGMSNLNVRLMALQGTVDLTAVQEGCADITLWASFDEMLAAYEIALAETECHERTLRHTA
jgi:hypothetical protein